jgi:uncharacterized lipoprotein YmbA
MHATTSILRRLALLGPLAALALGGCSSAEPRLYVLTPLPPTGDGEGGNTRSVGVLPATMPEYLDRAEIVTYASAHELTASRDDRWAERLPSNVTRVMAENLSSLLGTDRVYVMPSRRNDQSDYEVAVEFDRFERTAAGESVLDARWTILDGATRKVVATDRTRLAARVPDDGYASLVAAMSENLTRLSREVAAGIATAIASAPTRRNGRASS